MHIIIIYYTRRPWRSAMHTRVAQTHQTPSHSVTTRDHGMSSVRRVHGTAAVVVAFVVFRLSRLYNICNNKRL